MSVQLSAAKRLSSATILAVILCGVSLAQQLGSPQSRMPQRAQFSAGSLLTRDVDETQLTVLKGNTHPLARAEFDLGTAPATQPMQRMLLVLQRSPGQESALRALLDQQQDKSSPNYHKWLTPEEFGKQFGPSDSDIQTISLWLQSNGFQVGSTKGRTVLEFSGSASQVQQAFHTSIHKYVVRGEQYWANAGDPSIPAALTSAVAGLASLNNFPRRPMNRFAGSFTREKSTGKVSPSAPLFTFQPGFTCSADTYCFALGPYDFATIYNVLPLWNANINGTGQTIAIVGESNINAQDVANFRSLFGLPANSAANGNPLNIILNGPDPGPQGDESEADIDVQWSGAVAPYATIDFVVSETTETTSGIDLSAVYIVDNNLAPVMSESYGYCELGLGTTGNQFYNNLWQQAAAQGITVFISAGDNGAAGCDDFGAQSPSPAQFGLEVSGYASTPYNVAVGGTDFNEFTNPTGYWSTTNNSNTQASALGYIPESTWNDSCTNAVWGTVGGFSQNAETNCNDQRLNDVVPVGGSGGVSNCTTPSGNYPATCAGGYVKPSWQTGNGVPNDGKRDLPDVSLFASNGFAGSFYVICQADQQDGSCSSSNPYQNFLGFGGTSVSSPAFAGIMALVNQQTGSRQGNANYILYKLAAKQSDSICNSSTGPASSCIFNDVTSGTNAMPCAAGSSDCTVTISGDVYGILNGYNAGPGFDLATGLGSVNANNLVTEWSSVSSLASTTTLNSLTPTTITHGQSVSFSVTVKPQSGSGTAPAGEISLLGGSSGNASASIGYTLSGGNASGTTNLLPGGTYSVTAHYAGDGTYAASTSNPISVTVNKESSAVQAFLVTFDSNNNVISSDTTTAAYGSPYVLRVNVENSARQLCTPAAAAGANGCPTGNVTMTNNGALLDLGTYVLNSYGFFEDQPVQLPGGTNSVVAQYAGDGSFASSSATTSFSITPAATSMLAPASPGITAGYPFQINTTINTTSSGAGPTGTVTFSANGAPLSGSVFLSPVAGSLTSPAYTAASLTGMLSVPGTYSFSANYSGDGNYAGSTAPASAAVSVKYPTPTTYVQSSSYSVAAGTAVTLTAEIIATSGSAVPSGTVSFTNSIEPITGVTYSTVTNTSTGYTDLLATVTFTPSFTDNYSASYSGDNNYPSSNGSSTVTVNGSDFTLSFPQPSVTLIQGQYTQLNMFVGVQTGAGTVTFSASPCSGLPAESSCSANSSSVTSTYMNLLNINTTGPTALLERHSTFSWYAALWTVSFPMLGALWFLTVGPRRGKWRILFALLMLFCLAVLPSCGGGGSSGGGGGGGGNPGTPAGTYTVTVTATSTGSAAVTHTATFTLVVKP